MINKIDNLKYPDHFLQVRENLGKRVCFSTPWYKGRGLLVAEISNHRFLVSIDKINRIHRCNYTQVHPKGNKIPIGKYKNAEVIL